MASRSLSVLCITFWYSQALIGGFFSAAVSVSSIEFSTKRATHGSSGTSIPYYAYSQFTLPELLCGAVNNAENDLRQQFFALAGGPDSDPEPYYSAIFNVTAALNGDQLGPFSGDYTFEEMFQMEKLRGCIALDQAARTQCLLILVFATISTLVVLVCTAFCPEYGVNGGEFPCPETYPKIINACSYAFNNIGAKKRANNYFGFGIYSTLRGSQYTGGNGDPSWTQTLDAWKQKV